MTIPTPLPSTHRALLLTSKTQPPTPTTLPLPQIKPGTILLRILSTPIISYTREVFLTHERPYPYPLPIIPGFSAIARVAASSDDTPTLSPNQLVFFDTFVRSRTVDASGAPDRYLSALHQGFTATSAKLMEQTGWRDGSMAEYMLAPAENCYVLDERLITAADPREFGGLGLGLGYTAAELSALATLLVPYGGLRDVELRVGQTVLVSPATGQFGGAAALLALSMGAKVLAWGRNVSRLETLKAKTDTVANGRYRGMLSTMPLTADAAVDLAAIKSSAGPGGIDVFFDISPPESAGSHHIKTGILALRFGGCASLMGGVKGDVAIPHGFVMHQDIRLRGKWMYERRDVVEMIHLVESGVVKLGVQGGWSVTGGFGLEEWREAWDLAAEKTAVGEMVVLEP